MPLMGYNKGVPKGKFRAPGTYMEKKNLRDLILIT